MFIWLLFAIVIPVVATLGIVLMIASVADADIKGMIKNKSNTIPGVSLLFDTNEEVSSEEQLESANQTIAHQKETITALQDETVMLEGKLEALEMELKKLEKKQNIPQTDSKEIEPDANVKQLATSFRKMEASKAAEIMQNLDQITAANLLILLQSEIRGDILAEMEPKRAAELMERMLEGR